MARISSAGITSGLPVIGRYREVTGKTTCAMCGLYNQEVRFQISRMFIRRADDSPVEILR